MNKNYKKDIIKKPYENFPLWSSFYLKSYMSDLKALYYFCRRVDDISDLDKHSAKKELSKLEKSLNLCFKGNCKENNELFDLMHTIKKFSLPKDEFQKLISANYQDLEVNKYETFEKLVKYCELSANPVGHLVLKIFGDLNQTNLKFSDEICTGLQLINFIQDINRDSKLGRIYMPQEDIERFIFFIIFNV